MSQDKQKTLMLNAPPQATLQYCKNWFAHLQREGKAAAGHVPLLEDIVKLLEVACDALTPTAEEKNN